MMLLMIAAGCLSAGLLLNIWYTRREALALWDCLIALTNSDTERKPTLVPRNAQTTSNEAERSSDDLDAIGDIGVEHPSAKDHSTARLTTEKPTRPTGRSAIIARRVAGATQADALLTDQQRAERLVVDRAELFATVYLYGSQEDIPLAFQLLKDALERAGRRIA